MAGLLYQWLAIALWFLLAGTLINNINTTYS